MKKAAIAAVIILSLLASACASSDSESASSADESESATTRAPSATVAPTTTSTLATPSTTTTTRATTTTGPPAKDPVVADSAFWNDNDGGGGWVAIVENPNTDWAFLNVFFDIALIDAENRVLDTDFGSVEFLLPGGRTAIRGSAFDLPAPIADLEFEASWDNEDVVAEELGEWLLTDLTVDQERRRTEVGGDVSSTFQDEFEFVEVVAVFLDENGALVYADSAYVDTVFPERKAFFEVASYDVPVFETVEAYVSP